MSKLTLDSVEWGEFRIKDLFELHLSKGDNQANLLDEGDIPLVSSGLNINGISKFIKEGDGKSELFAGNVFTVDMFGKASYHEYNFFSVSHGRINILIPKFKMTKFMAIFIVAEIDKNFSNVFSYNRMCSQKRLRSSKILLPMDSNGNPNWQFMEDYIKKEMKKQSQKVITYYENKLMKLGLELLHLIDDQKEINRGRFSQLPSKEVQIYELAKQLSNKYVLKNTMWKAFFIEDICDIISGKDIYERERINGKTPYVTATSANNGIGYFISNNNTTLQEKCISVNRNGSVGYSFYHSYPALFGNDTRKLIPKYNDDHVAKFISFMISSQKEKYGYGYKMGTARLKRQKILLPINKDESINYEFMKLYMIIQEIILLYSTLDYYKQR